MINLNRKFPRNFLTVSHLTFSFSLLSEPLSFHLHNTVSLVVAEKLGDHNLLGIL